jgi:hypothetical protein
METQVRKRVISRIVEEEVESLIFISKDGTIFDNEVDCLKYEEEINFNDYFKTQYSLEYVDIKEYGLNFGQTTFCHLVYVNKINDEVINDFIKFYKLEDYPDDLIKMKEGWSFIALINDVNLWVFNKTDRIFMIEPLIDVVKGKRREVNLLNYLLKKKENEKIRRNKK